MCTRVLCGRRPLSKARTPGIVRSVASLMKRKERDLASLLAVAKPSMVILDLDYTLWRGNCDEFADSRVISSTEAADAKSGKSLHVYPEVHEVFGVLVAHSIPIAIASAASAAETATRLLRAFRLPVQATQIFPGKKDTHLRAIARGLQRSLERAIFLDDIPHNIKTAQSLGVGACVLVKDGLTVADVATALDALQQRRRGATLMQAWLGRSDGSGSSSSDSVREGARGGSSGSTSSAGAGPGASGLDAPEKPEDQGRGEVQIEVEIRGDAALEALKGSTTQRDGAPLILPHMTSSSSPASDR